MSPKRVTLLGSSGSIGTSAVDVIARHPQDFIVEALVGYQNIETLAEQTRLLRPRLVVVGDESYEQELRRILPSCSTKVASGFSGILEAASLPADWILSALVGVVGLAPTLQALKQGTTVAFANKECLVCAGRLMIEQSEKSGATLLPVDSEHNALFQIIAHGDPDDIDRVILTASGGPFRATDPKRMSDITPEEALRHPTWSMGKKILIDSATMMNKGLEIIEAHYLFDLPSHSIEVVIHPQSIIHGMVEYKDGSMFAHLGAPDMRLPIAHTLAWPDRMETPVERLDFGVLSALTFEPPDMVKFPCLSLAREALKEGGAAPCVLNAANEICVQAFLEKRIGFLTIAHYVEKALDKLAHTYVDSLDEIYAIDAATRRLTLESLPA